jgi:hypothetical protein
MRREEIRREKKRKEQKRTEKNRTEEKRKEKEENRKEKKRTDKSFCFNVEIHLHRQHWRCICLQSESKATNSESTYFLTCGCWLTRFKFE